MREALAKIERQLPVQKCLGGQEVACAGDDVATVVAAEEPLGAGTGVGVDAAVGRAVEVQGRHGDPIAPAQPFQRGPERSRHRAII